MGIEVGSDVGTLVGTLVGAEVGKNVGFLVGLRVGGLRDGLRVAGVGSAALHINTIEDITEINKRTLIFFNKIYTIGMLRCRSLKRLLLFL